MHDDKTEKEYEAMGIAPPSTESHNVSIDDVRAKMVKLEPTNWRLHGNELIADTEMGELVQYIPTNFILTGEDENGLPTFREIG